MANLTDTEVKSYLQNSMKESCNKDKEKIKNDYELDCDVEIKFNSIKVTSD